MFKRNFEINFLNTKTKKYQFIKFNWCFDNGFEYESDLIKRIRMEKQKPADFLCVRMFNELYGVGISSENKMCLMSKYFTCYYDPEKNEIYSYMKGKLEEPPYKICYDPELKFPNLNLQMFQLMEELDPNLFCYTLDVNKRLNSKFMQSAFSFFGECFFDTMIDVYELSCLKKQIFDEKCIENMIQNGIVSINPFHKTFQRKSEEGNNDLIYTFAEYKERSLNKYKGNNYSDYEELEEDLIEDYIDKIKDTFE